MTEVQKKPKKSPLKAFQKYDRKVRIELINLANRYHKDVSKVVNDFEVRCCIYLKDSKLTGIEKQLKAIELLEQYYAHSGDFKPGYFADIIISKYNVITPIDSVPCMFNGKVYVADANFYELEQTIRNTIGPAATAYHVKEVIKSLASKTLNRDIQIYNPNNKYLCVKNGVIDLDTGKLHNHARDILSFRYLDIDYDPKANTEAWDKYIDSLVKKKEVVRFKQSMGDILNPNYVSKKASWWWGNYNSGRSTLGDNIKSILGQSNCSHLSLLQIGNDRVRTSIFGKFANIRVEDDIHFKLNNISHLKEFTGEDTVELPVLYQARNLVFNSIAKLLYGGNSTPTTSIDRREFYERFNPFTFPYTHVKNPKFKQMWAPPEMRSIALKGMVDANIELRKNAYEFEDMPDWYEIRDFFQKYSTKNWEATNGFILWARERLVNDPSAYVFAYELYKDCEEWCKNKKLTGYPGNEMNMGKSMKEVKSLYPYNVKNPLSKFYGIQKTAYEGIRLKDGDGEWRAKYNGIR